jgi:hypothetical protein
LRYFIIIKGSLITFCKKTYIIIVIFYYDTGIFLLDTGVFAVTFFVRWRGCKINDLANSPAMEIGRYLTISVLG